MILKLECTFSECIVHAIGRCEIPRKFGSSPAVQQVVTRVQGRILGLGHLTSLSGSVARGAHFGRREFYGSGDYLPSRESTPQASQIIKLTPTEPVRTSKPEGDTKIPDPVD